MKGFLKSKKFKLILCILAFCIGIMIYAYTHKGYTTGFERAVNSLFNPIRSITWNIGDSISTKLDRFTNTDSAYDENKKLKSEIANYKQMEADYDSTKRELADLKKFMGIKDDNKDFVLSEPCKIIGYVTNDPYKSFYIDKGKEDGIEYYCPVVTSEGLVGIISEVSNDYSVVTTILSGDISVSAQASKSQQTGVITGSMEAISDNMTEMNHIEKKKNGIKNGEIVVTAQGSGIFPKGYLIGTVKNVKSSDSGLTNSATIEPAVDFNNISTVMCILDFDGKGKIEKTHEKPETTTSVTTNTTTQTSVTTSNDIKQTRVQTPVGDDF